MSRVYDSIEASKPLVQDHYPSGPEDLAELVRDYGDTDEALRVAGRAIAHWQILYKKPFAPLLTRDLERQLGLNTHEDYELHKKVGVGMAEGWGEWKDGKVML